MYKLVPFEKHFLEYIYKGRDNDLSPFTLRSSWRRSPLLTFSAALLDEVFFERNLSARQIAASFSFWTFFHCEGTIYKFNSMYNNHQLMSFCMIHVFNCFGIVTDIDESIKRCCRNYTIDCLSWQCAVGIMQLSCEIQLLEGPVSAVTMHGCSFFWPSQPPTALHWGLWTWLS